MTIHGETTHLEYRVFRKPGGKRQMSGQVAMAGYYLDVNAERLGLDTKTLKILVAWPSEEHEECRFLIDAQADEKIVRLAFIEALQSVGLAAEVA